MYEDYEVEETFDTIEEEVEYNGKDERENAAIEERRMKQYDEIDESGLQLVRTEERKDINGVTQTWYIYNLPNTRIWCETNNNGSQIWYKR